MTGVSTVHQGLKSVKFSRIIVISTFFRSTEKGIQRHNWKNEPNSVVKSVES